MIQDVFCLKIINNVDSFPHWINALTLRTVNLDKFNSNRNKKVSNRNLLLPFSLESNFVRERKKSIMRTVFTKMLTDPLAILKSRGLQTILHTPSGFACVNRKPLKSCFILFCFLGGSGAELRASHLLAIAWDNACVLGNAWKTFLKRNGSPFVAPENGSSYLKVWSGLLTALSLPSPALTPSHAPWMEAVLSSTPKCHFSGHASLKK